jgi:molybdate transport system substrate-binding protein
LKSTAGAHFAKVAGQLGITATVAPRYRTFPNGSTAMAEMAKAQGRPIGCTQSTEILATPGVVLVAPLPPGLDLSTTYTAAVSTHAANPADAARFVAALTAPAAASARRTAGFQ